MGSIEEDIVRADAERRDRFIKQLHALLDLRAAVARTEIVLALDPECVWKSTSYPWTWKHNSHNTERLITNHARQT